MHAWAVAALDLVFPALCPVCEAPIRDLGEATAKWDKL